jgi:hypothetical protein
MAKKFPTSGGTPGVNGEPPCIDAGSGSPPEDTPPWVRGRVPGDGGGYLAADDADFRVRYPTLHSFLCLTGRKGAVRKTGTMLLFAEDGVFKACLSDRDEGYIAFLTHKSVEGLLDAADKALFRGALEWRVSKWRSKG